MPKEIIKLRRSRKTPYESAAHFFAILAYPEAEDRLERERFWQSLCRWAIVTRMAIEPDWGRTYQWIRPAVFSAEDTLHNAILKRGTKRVHQRLAAANYGALPRLEELKFGKKLKAVEGYSPTLNNMAILMGEAMGWKGDDSQATAKTKIWKPTRPVLHAASAWIYWRRSLGPDPSPEHFMSFFFDPTLVKDVVWISEQFRVLLPKIKRYKTLKDTELIKLSI